MKKHIISMLLCLALIFAFAACSAPVDALVGNWEATLDLADYFNTAISDSDPEIAKYIHADSFGITLHLQVNEDLTYTLSVDEDALNTTLLELKEMVITGMEEYLVVTLRNSGIEMSIEEILSLTGMDIEALVDEMVTTSVYDTLTYSVEDGTLVADEETITMTPADTSVAAYTMTYTVADNTLTLDMESDELNNVLTGMFPIRFEKVS